MFNTCRMLPIRLDLQFLTLHQLPWASRVQQTVITTLGYAPPLMADHMTPRRSIVDRQDTKWFWGPQHCDSSRQSLIPGDNPTTRTDWTRGSFRPEDDDPLCLSSPQGQTPLLSNSTHRLENEQSSVSHRWVPRSSVYFIYIKKRVCFHFGYINKQDPVQYPDSEALWRKSCLAARRYSCCLLLLCHRWDRCVTPLWPLLT